MAVAFPRTKVISEPRRLGTTGWRLLVGFLLFEQFILPVGRIGPMPFKLGYVLIPLLVVLRYSVSMRGRSCELAGLSRVQREAILYFACVIGCGVIGQFIYSLQYSLSDGDFVEFFRFVALYLLMLFAFLFGGSHPSITSGQVLFIYLLNASLFLLLSFGGHHVPWLMRMYEVGTKSSDPSVTGMWPNPNCTMLLHNMILMGLYLTYKYRRGKPCSVPVYVAVLVISVVIGVRLGSRGEFASLLVIVALFVHQMIKRAAVSVGKAIFVGCMALLITSLIGVWLWGGITSVVADSRLYARVAAMGLSTHGASFAERPWKWFAEAGERFTRGPICGTGFGTCGTFPFQHPPKSYHNDWLRILVSGGVVGMMAMLLIVFRLAAKADWILVLPFVLPGLTNSFLQLVPAVLVFFIYVGAFQPLRTVGPLMENCSQIDVMLPSGMSGSQ